VESQRIAERTLPYQPISWFDLVWCLFDGLDGMVSGGRCARWRENIPLIFFEFHTQIIKSLVLIKVDWWKCKEVQQVQSAPETAPQQRSERILNIQHPPTPHPQLAHDA
jgi:hypothetical protein